MVRAISRLASWMRRASWVSCSAVPRACWRLRWAWSWPWLAPFMLVAGDHAKNDLGGDEEDSWASMLRKEGFTVKTHLRGLGENPGIRAVFSRHARTTEDDLMTPKQAH